MRNIPAFHAEQISEAAKSISTLKAREDEQKKRRKAAEEGTEKIRKVSWTTPSIGTSAWVKESQRRGTQLLHSAYDTQASIPELIEKFDAQVICRD